jgi:hypothetical protein
MSFVASSEDELSVELAGMICRLLIDRGTRARLAVSGKPGEVLIDVDDEDALLVSTPVPGDEGKAALLADAGWTESPQGGRLVRRLLSPVVVITPAALASRALFRVLGLENAGQLVLALEDRRAVAEPPEQMAARQEL